jgi:hypothetical protein
VKPELRSRREVAPQTAHKRDRASLSTG